ncbi:MAG: hypothetical protein K9J16_03910 [Melioribacteraceae bacterium]|nr:hypothetical protein [Melioribacteraceae bacterium]MCF8394675.1 hypothetical protein [Melioribacteraceae bacterium]MCF8417991.1 hypothetical protein [Melioribacteraceae bacterium]
MKTTLLLLSFLMISQVSIFGFNQNEGIKDTTSEKKVQIGVSAGYVYSACITNANGPHPSFWGDYTNLDVEGIDIIQDWSLGINSRYYFKEKFYFLFDFIYSRSLFPEQKVILGGSEIDQPISDQNYYTFSIGAGFSYTDAGIWQTLNPYASLSLSVQSADVSDVNFLPSYGRGGSSKMLGKGFTLQLGTQYNINSIFLSLEYRYEYLDTHVDHFRSFVEGLDFTKNTSYFLLGIGFTF